mgnify:FL=1
MKDRLNLVRYRRMKIRYLIIPFILFSSSIMGQEIGGTGWLFTQEDGDKDIVLFKKDGTLHLLQLISNSGNEGEVFSGEDNTWFVNGTKLVISYNNGFMVCSFQLSNRVEMLGTCINKWGLVEKHKGKLIE